jgi:hypothetical protein
MIVKRLGAIVLAVILILGALVVRDRVIDDNGGSGDDDPPRADREIVCVSDLRDVCDALADDRDIRIEPAGATLDELAALDDPADAPIWITMHPFPAMVDDLRVGARREPLNAESTVVASSPITLVMAAGESAALTAECGEPLEWECIGEAAGNPWTEIGSTSLQGDVRPAFARISTAIGILGVADAVAGYFGTSPIQTDEPEFVSWARRLADAVPATAVTGANAIATIEVRRSALDIAVGAEAELSENGRASLGLQYADPMIRADVVVAVPDGASLPSGLAADLGRLLVTDGNWDPPSAEPNPLPDARELLAIRSAWMAFT